MAQQKCLGLRVECTSAGRVSSLAGPSSQPTCTTFPQGFRATLLPCCLVSGLASTHRFDSLS